MEDRIGVAPIDRFGPCSADDGETEVEPDDVRGSDVPISDEFKESQEDFEWRLEPVEECMDPGRRGAGRSPSLACRDEALDERLEPKALRFFCVAGRGMTTDGNAAREKRGAVVVVSQFSLGSREMEGAE